MGPSYQLGKHLSLLSQPVLTWCGDTTHAPLCYVHDNPLKSEDRPGPSWWGYQSTKIATYRVSASFPEETFTHCHVVQLVERWGQHSLLKFGVPWVWSHQGWQVDISQVEMKDCSQGMAEWLRLPIASPGPSLIPEEHIFDFHMNQCKFLTEVQNVVIK